MSGIDPYTVLTLFGGYTFVAGTVFSGMIDFNLRNKLKSREDKIEETKEILRAVLSDEITYPTHSSKIHALLKKNEFSFSIKEDVDGIFDEACRQLSREITAQSRNRQNVAVDNAVGVEISKINGQLATLPLEDRIATLLTPEFKAKMSVFFRLKKQQDLEKIAEGAFERTSSSKFYQPMTEKETGGFEGRTKAWETSMEEAQKRTAEWGKQRKSAG